jgi:hypothetical protein
VACTGEDVVWSSGEAASSIHKCEEWGLEADFSKLESEFLVVLRISSLGVEITLRTD